MRLGRRSKVSRAMGLVLLGASLATGQCVPPAWAQSPSPAPLPAWLAMAHLSGLPAGDTTRARAWTPDFDAVIRALPPDEDVTLRTSVNEGESADLRTVLGRGERWHVVHFGAVARSRALETTLTGYGHLGYMPRGPEDVGGVAEDLREPGLLGVKSEVSGFEVGVEYRSVGKRFDRVVRLPQGKKDQEGTEVWLARRLDFLRLRLAQSSLTDNVDRNLALPQTTRTQTAATAELVLPSLPIFGLTYAVGDADRVRLGPDGRPDRLDRRASRTVSGTGSIYHGATAWDLTLSTTYVQSREATREASEADGLYHDLSVTLRPTWSITVVPTLSRGQERYLATGARSDADAASLTITCELARHWHAWAYGAYTKSRITDGSVDGRSMSAGAGIAWAPGRLLARSSSISLEGGYDRYLDGVRPESSARGVFGFILFKMAPF